MRSMVKTGINPSQSIPDIVSLHVYERSIRDLKEGIVLFRSGEIWNDVLCERNEFVWGFALSVVIGIPLWNSDRLVQKARLHL